MIVTSCMCISGGAASPARRGRATPERRGRRASRARGWPRAARCRCAPPARARLSALHSHQGIRSDQAAGGGLMSPALEVVGRESETDSVHDFLEAVSGGPIALLIEGEAGIGKTTLWREGIAEAGERGLRVLTSRPVEAETALDSDRLTRLIIGPLDIRSLDRLLRAQLDRQFLRPALVELQRVSGGNPFFALELGRALLTRDVSPAPGEPLPVPATLN